MHTIALIIADMKFAGWFCDDTFWPENPFIISLI